MIYRLILLKETQDSKRWLERPKSPILNSVCLIHFQFHPEEMVWEAADAHDCSRRATAVILVLSLTHTHSTFPLRIFGVRGNNFCALDPAIWG